ncbi:hypothetical protein R6138_04566 [Ralstonia thomasii]|nr:hypothetical protein R6138_04566 [Ralstonia sp. LMG 18095]
MHILRIKTANADYRGVLLALPLYGFQTRQQFKNRDGSASFRVRCASSDIHGTAREFAKILPEGSTLVVEDAPALH